MTVSRRQCYSAIQCAFTRHTTYDRQNRNRSTIIQHASDAK